MGETDLKTKITPKLKFLVFIPVPLHQFSVGTQISYTFQILYFSAYKMETFPFQNKPKNLDLS